MTEAKKTQEEEVRKAVKKVESLKQEARDQLTQEAEYEIEWRLAIVEDWVYPSKTSRTIRAAAWEKYLNAGSEAEAKLHILEEAYREELKATQSLRRLKAEEQKNGEDV